jgi:WD40-like Beta Propeller Repeat
VFAPGVRQPPHFPGRTFPFVLSVLVIGGMLVAWAFLAASPLGNESLSTPLPLIRPESVRSVAYIVPGRERDYLYVRSIDGGSPRILDTFPAVSFANLHARGAAAPTADRIAVLSVADPSKASAQMTLIDVTGGGRQVLGVSFDYLSALGWSADGQLVAGVISQPASDGPGSGADVLVVNASTGEAAVAAHFDNVFQLAPVGYSFDRERLLVVAIDQSGSTLWAIRNGKSQKVATLSTGRTRDWSLSPDGSRLAFVDIVPAGERSYAGRTLLIATGAVTDSASNGNELGPGWMPGAQVPVFGGPGGGIRLNPPSPEGDYVVPASWAPDGTTLVATIYSASSDRSAPPEESVELVTSTTRVRLAEEPGARFLGWVHNIE